MPPKAVSGSISVLKAKCTNHKLDAAKIATLTDVSTGITEDNLYELDDQNFAFILLYSQQVASLMRENPYICWHSFKAYLEAPTTSLNNKNTLINQKEGSAEIIKSLVGLTQGAVKLLSEYLTTPIVKITAEYAGFARLTKEPGGSYAEAEKNKRQSKEGPLR